MRVQWRFLPPEGHLETYMQMCTKVQKHIQYTHTHTHTNTHTHTHIHTYIHTYTHIHIHTHTHANTHTDTRTHKHTHTHTYTHIHIHKYTYSYTLHVLSIFWLFCFQLHIFASYCYRQDEKSFLCEQESCVVLSLWSISLCNHSGHICPQMECPAFIVRK